MSNIVIVGSGPAGVSAALYAVRAGVHECMEKSDK